MTHEEAENLGADNESSLQTLVRAITLSQGEFSLILLRCNYGALRQQMVQRIHELSTVKIREITLPASVKTLYSAIKTELGDEQPPALMIFGLESVKDIDTVLTAANQVREEFRKNFPFPILLWINDQVLQKMIRLAADLDNWATTIAFNNSTHNLIEFMREKTDEIFAGDVKPNLQICWELTTARQDLQSREQLLAPEIIASIEFVLGFDDYLYDRIDGALGHYQESLGFWRGSQNLERYGILLAHVALAYQRKANIEQVENQGYWQEARNYFQQAIVIFESAQKPDLIAEYISKLGEVLRSLQAWRDLQGLAEQALILHENYGTARQLAQDYGFLAEVALQNSHWDEAQQFAEQALEVLASWREILNVMASNAEQSPPVIAIAAQQSQPTVNEANQSSAVIASAAQQSQPNANEAKQPQPNVNEANQLEEIASLHFVTFAMTSVRLLANEANLQSHEGGLYRFILASSQQGLGDIAAAISSLELAKLESKPQYNPQLYISILEKLRLLYFEQARYLDAFHLKQERLQIEQQYGFRAFVGASYLNPQRQAINPALIQAENTETIAQEIAVSSRVQDVRRLRERVSGTEHKLTVIHGQSGVGKSSILQGGLIPALQEKPIGERDALPILLRSYTDWVGMLGRILVESVERLGGISLNSAAEILAQLRNNAERNLLTVLIFDQFEEFFFVYKDQAQRRPFYEFLRVCLDIPFVKVILSLREDYLHYLLELDRIFDLTVINNNILDKNIRYHLGNFSRDDAKTVIQSLTERTHFYLEPNLIDELVKDLAGDIGEVRPIELQIVGAQLQTEKITSLERYRQAGTKEKLVERFLDEVIKDCGAVNESTARLILYLLTDENGTRPLKTKAELAADLATSAEELDLVLEIFVKSGLVLILKESPAERYQLVHDYLVDLIRQQQGNELLEELAREREQRLQAEENLEREQAAKKILADANREAKQKIKQGRNRLALSSGLAIVLLLAAGLAALYAINKISEANIANKEKQDSLAKMAEANTNLENVNLQKLETEKRLGEIQKIAKGLEDKKQDLEKNYQKELNNKKVAEAESAAAKKATQQANKNLLTAKAELDKVNQEAATLQQRNAQAEERIKTANVNVKAAEEKVKLADIRQKKAELKARQADENLSKAQASLRQAQSAKIAAEVAQKEALQGTNLERAGANALRQFEYTELESLVSAMHSGKDLKNIVKDGRQLEKYPAFSPIYALHSILSNIKERNQFQGHQSSVLSVSFSPDGKTIATASSDNTARLWNLQGQLLQEFKGHQYWVRSVSFSPDGKTIASASSDNTARLWNLQGQLLQEFKGHQYWVRSVSFSPDGKTIATASSDNTARLWNLQGQLLQEFTGHQDGVRGVSFSPDGKTIATASDDKTARLWNLQGQLLQEFKGHQSSVWGVSFSPDGKTIATTSDDKTARLWNLQGQLLQEFTGHQSSVRGVSFSPDGKTIATASSDKTARLWNLQGQLLQEFKGHQDSVISVSFSPDGKTIATASSDNTARLWNLQEFKGHQDGVRGVSFSPDGKTIATTSDDKTARLWNLQGQLLQEFTGHKSSVWGVSFSPDSKTIATASSDNTARLWNLQGQLLQEFTGHKSSVWGVSFSPDSKTIATASSDNTARLWNLQGQLLQEFTGHQDSVWGVSFSPDSKTIATASSDNTARLWNLQGQLLQEFTGHQDSVWGVSFSPDGKTIATASLDKTARLWNLQGQLLQEFTGHQGYVWGVSFSPDGKTIATASSDKTARLWNLQGQLLQEFKGHQESVNSVSFSPDGKTIATASSDKTARLWNLQGQLLQEFKGHQESVNSVSFSPDGKTIATASLDKTARLWPVENLDELLVRGCGWLQLYLKNPNVNLSEGDRHLCDNL
ncbi:MULTISPECIES: hypothetical protein [unclassified Tolypothrix]|uniref:WD40 domain-containing protein n=1 Tax=unclassified Tolypothrix TaxID=2649714 RepID=UPI0021E04EC2|nr:MULTISPECIES: hypothetical protein [unclassified Tolypothrix]